MATIAEVIGSGGAGKATIAPALSAARCLPRPSHGTLLLFMRNLAGLQVGPSLRLAPGKGTSPAVCYRHCSVRFLMSFGQLHMSSMKLVRIREHSRGNALRCLQIAWSLDRLSTLK